MSRFNLWASSGSGWMVILSVALAVLCIVGGIFAVHRAKSPTPSVAITTVSLGDRDVAQGAMDVELARLKLTADASSDAVVSSITITEAIGGSVRSSRAIYNLELLTGPALNTPEHKLMTKISGSVYAANWDFGRVMYVISIDRGVVVPAGATIDILLVGDILSDALPGSTHLIRPGTETRDGATIDVDKGRSAPRVYWKIPDGWPEGNVITIAPSPDAAK